MITISLNPIAFTIGSLPIRWYGIFVALAIGVLVLWMVWQMKKGVKLSYDTILTAALVGVPSGIILSKLLHVWDRMDYYRSYPGQMWTTEGLTIWGAILGAALGIWVYSKIGKFQFGYFADALAPGILLAQAIGRVGCTINGCCYGEECSLPWGVVYTNPESFAPLNVAVHPTQVYEIIFLLAAFAVLTRLRDHLKPDGSILLLYLSLYSIWRVGIDFIRAGTPFFLGLHQAQVISLLVLAIAVPLLAYRTRWVKTGDEVEQASGEEDGAQPSDRSE